MSNNRQKLIMLVEDNAIISLMLECDLIENGLASVGPFTTCAVALRWLDDNNPDAAVLDVSLVDGPCTRLAATLKDRGIPFVVHSGYEEASAAEEFQGAPWVNKPSPTGVVTEAVARALRGAEAVYR